MPTQRRLPASGTTVFPTGPFSVEIDTPTRSSSAVVTVERTATVWPVGPLFTYQISERNRGSSTLNVLMSGAESGTGEEVIGRDGTVNSPFRITLRWANDADKDIIRFEGEVLQPFTSSILVEFL